MRAGSQRCWSALVVALAAVAVLGPVPVQADPRSGLAVQPNTCATAYHRQLARLAPAAAKHIGTALTSARAPEPDWLGKWRFWDPHNEALRRKLARVGYGARVIVIENQVCANAVVGQGGRIRCLKWVPKPENYVPPKLPSTDEPGEAPLPQPNERARLRDLSAFVRARGALAELRRPEALYHLTQRSSDELRGYLSQPPVPSLCSGSQAMLAFYRDKLRPIERLLATSRAHWLAAWTAARQLGSSGLAIPPPTDRAQAQTLLQAAAVELAARFVTRDKASVLRRSPALMDVLAEVDAALQSPMAREAAPSDLANARLGLRHIETAHFALVRSEKYAAVVTAFSATMDAIAAAHTATCTCASD